MKKKLLSALLALCMVLSLLPAVQIEAKADSEIWNPSNTATQFEDGNGTSSNPYQIATAEQLALMTDKVNNYNNVATGDLTFGTAFYKLTDNIVLNDTSDWETWTDTTAGLKAWTPIGNSTNKFSGTFDGDGKTVSGIYINSTVAYQGLFGITNGAKIENVTVKKSYIKGTNTYVGSIVSYSVNSTITNCTNSGAVSGKTNVGGIVAANIGGTVTDCTNNGKVSGTGGNVGGIVGKSQSGGNVTDCTNTGTVNGCSNDVGGVVGNNGYYKGDPCQITSCKNTGAVTGTDQVGGITGNSNSVSSLNGCTNNAKVSGTGSNVGGVCGANDGGTIENCYNTGAVSCTRDNVGGVCGLNKGTVTSSYNTGTVSGTNYYVGGVCGLNCPYSKVTNCYNSGTVSGRSNIGGVCGLNNGTVGNCCNSGNIIGQSGRGNIAGYNSGTITMCYYDKQMDYHLDKGIYGSNNPGHYEGKFTIEMLGDGLKNILGSKNWLYEKGMYPRLKDVAETDTAIVYATPILLNTNDTTNKLTTDFTVSTKNGVVWTSGNPNVIKINGENASVLRNYSFYYSPALTATLNGVTKKVVIYKTTLPSYAVSATTNSVEANGITATATFGTSPYAADSTATVTIALSGTATQTGTHTIGLTSTKSSTITPPTTVIKAVAAGDTMTDADTFAFTFTMPSNAVDDLVVTHTYAPSQSTTPTAITSVVNKTEETQTSVDFTLDSELTGTWKVYDAATGGNIVDGVIASVDGATLTLTHASNIPAGTYYVAVKEDGKTESARLELTVAAKPTYDVSATTNDVETNGVTATATFGASPYAADETTAVAITLSGTATQAGTHTIGLTSTKAGTITPSTFTKTVAEGDSPTDTFEFTFTMPANVIDDLGVTNTFEKANTGGGGEYIPPYIPPVKPDTGAEIIVNGKKQTAGDAETSEKNGQTVTTVTVDTKKLEKVLESEGQGAAVIIPVKSDSDVATGALNGQMVKDMETKEATLEIKTNSVSYTLPASEIDINRVSEQFGEDITLKDIDVEITIAEPSDKTVNVVEDAAKNGDFSIMVPAVDFTINCTYNGQITNVSSFNSYIERLVAIPEGVDPTKITTGIVVHTDGTTHHVPTEVTIIDGKYYAKINSLTNSTYTVVWHPIEFSDVINHWAKDSINNMGSRMVINGVGGNNYDPDISITRAEVAAIVVRALGLDEGMGKETFTDVNESDWYCGYVKTAASYGIINGYGDGTFGPNDNITREQATAMIARAMKKTGLEVELSKSEITEMLSKYEDSISGSDYAKESIATCIKTEIIKGRENSFLAPKDNISRAEVAVIVERLLQKSELI